MRCQMVLCQRLLRFPLRHKAPAPVVVSAAGRSARRPEGSGVFDHILTIVIGCRQFHAIESGDCIVAGDPFRMYANAVPIN